MCGLPYLPFASASVPAWNYSDPVEDRYGTVNQRQDHQEAARQVPTLRLRGKTQ